MGSGLSKMIAGGALSGWGTGLVERAEHKRKVALQMIEEQARDSRDRQNRDFRAEEGERDREARRGLITTVDRAEDGTAYGITGGGDKVDLGYKRAKSATQLREERLAGKTADDIEGMSAGEKRDWDTTVSRFTEGYLDEEETNWSKVEAYFREKGNDKLADKAAANDTGDPEIDVESPAYKEADRQARAIADERKGLLKSRGEEFPETGGSEQEFINQKRMEILRQIEGGQGSAQPQAAPEQAAPEQAAEPEMAGKGSGSEQDPYRPTTQAEFDKIPSGAVYVNPADGALYRKN